MLKELKAKLIRLSNTKIQNACSRWEKPSFSRKRSRRRGGRAAASHRFCKNSSFWRQHIINNVRGHERGLRFFCCKKNVKRQPEKEASYTASNEASLCPNPFFLVLAIWGFCKCWGCFWGYCFCLFGELSSAKVKAASRLECSSRSLRVGGASRLCLREEST